MLLKKLVLQQPAGLNGCWIMLGLPRKKSKGPYLWRCWSSVLELHSRPRFLAKNDLLQAVPMTCSEQLCQETCPMLLDLVLWYTVKHLRTTKIWCQRSSSTTWSEGTMMSSYHLKDCRQTSLTLAQSSESPDWLREEGQSGNDVPLLKVTLAATKV